MFFFIDTFNILSYWPHSVFPFSFPPACSTSVLCIPFLLLITLLILWNNLLQVLWTAFFKTQLQKPLICQPYLKVSSSDHGSQFSLHLLLMLTSGLKLICPRDASSAWQHLSLITWELPGGLWRVCLLAFSFLQAEANSMLLSMLPACFMLISPINLVYSIC